MTGGAETRATDTSEPGNYPDSLSNGKQFIFVHGYSVHEEGARAWNAEMFKGRTILGLPVLGGTDWAGWGFSGEYSMAEANAASLENLRTNAVFRHEPAGMFSSNIVVQVRNDIIARGVSALSYAVGVNTLAPLGLDRNYDDEGHKPNGWGRSGGNYDNRWLHSDLKNMAYFYTYSLFDEIVSQGELQ